MIVRDGGVYLYASRFVYMLIWIEGFVAASFPPLSRTSSQSSMLQGIERFFKQALTDKSPAVTSAALVSSLVSMTCFF